MKVHEIITETATVGATSAGNIATVINPHQAIGKMRGNKAYTGTPGKSGTKAPNIKMVSQKNKDGTVKNALDMKNPNLFGGGAIKR